MFAVPEVQLRLELCGDVPNVILVEMRLHVRPVGVERETARATVPVRPLRAFTVIRDVPKPPAST